MIRSAGILFFILFTIEGYSQARAGQSGVITDVSVMEFRHLMDSLQGEVLVDLRTPEELQQQGKIAGAVEIDFFGDNFEPSIQALDSSKVYLLYCASGGRSGETAELMEKLGYKKIYNLREGFRAWAKQKMPVTKK